MEVFDAGFEFRAGCGPLVFLGGAGDEIRLEGPGRKDKMLLNETEWTAKVADRKSYGECQMDKVHYDPCISEDDACPSFLGEPHIAFSDRMYIHF